MATFDGVQALEAMSIFWPVTWNHEGQSTAYNDTDFDFNNALAPGTTPSFALDTTDFDNFDSFFELDHSLNPSPENDLQVDSTILVRGAHSGVPTDSDAVNQNVHPFLANANAASQLISQPPSPSRRANATTPAMELVATTPLPMSIAETSATANLHAPVGSPAAATFPASASTSASDAITATTGTAATTVDDSLLPALPFSPPPTDLQSTVPADPAKNFSSNASETQQLHELNQLPQEVFDSSVATAAAMATDVPTSTSMPSVIPVLGGPIALDETMTDQYVADFAFPLSMVNPDLPMQEAPAPEPQDRLSAFARLRFSDGNYYMHTYQIILGRNVELSRKDMMLLRQAKNDSQANKCEADNNVNGDIGRKRKRGHHRPRSIASHMGGIVNISASSLPAEYQQRRSSVASNSLSSSSNRHAGSTHGDSTEQAPQDVLMESLAPLPPQLESHVSQDPYDCPIVPIHPQDIRSMANIQSPKGISRRHAKIAYNFDKRYFELEVLSRNGLYHEDQFYRINDVVRLNHGDTIVIGAVDMTFTLPEVALTDEDRARNNGSESRPMSFSFENGQGELEEDDYDEESMSEGTSVNPKHIFYHTEDPDSDVDMIHGDEDDYEDDDEDISPEPRPKKHAPKPPAKQTLKISLKTSLKNKQPVPVPKKENKHSHKRKHVREQTPEEPPLKRPKKKIPEPEEVRPKEKEKEKASSKMPAKIPIKAPAKAPAKSPTKEVVKEPSPEKAEPEATPKPQSPVLVRETPLEGAVPIDDAKSGSIITVELAEQLGLPPSLIGQVLEKRSGPGRPPKDGLLSKRQKSALIKQGKELEKLREKGVDVSSLPALPVKPKTARPRKESTSNPIDGEDDDMRETTENGDGGPGSGEKKLSKPTKPPRTPSPEPRVEDYTEEQLQRPTANYVVLIHEAIGSSSTGQMNLQQIYTYIERKYPWYKFKTTTSGWQSSVRHNLSQHDAFVRGDKEGKGYNWKINPDVSIEKERRKRHDNHENTPPNNHPHAQRPGYYPPHNGYPAYGHPPTPYYPGMAPQGIQGLPNGLPRLPPSVESVQPRLPPSLQRNSTSGAAPATQAAPNPSPYSSPWAGGNSAGSPAQNPPRPYPPPHIPTPSANTSSTASGQYGVLMPTSGALSGATSSGSYQSQYATAGASPYASGPNRTYSPYATAGPSSNTPQQSSSAVSPPNGVSYPSANPTQVSHHASPYAGVNSTQPTSNGQPSNVAASNQSQTSHGQMGMSQATTNQSVQRPVASAQGAKGLPPVPHPSGRYPPSTSPLAVAQLEAFRQYYLEKTQLDRNLEKVKVDNAIQAFFNPASVPNLTQPEKDLMGSIQGLMSKFKDETGSFGASNGTVKEVNQVQQPQSNGSPARDAHSEVSSKALISSAAAIAAQDAAALASSQTTNPSATSSGKVETSSVPTSGTSAIPSATEPHKFTPTMVNPVTIPSETTSAATATATVPSPIGTRPSVEPLTPVPGSPAVAQGPLFKQALATSTDRGLEDAKAGVADESVRKLENEISAAAPEAPVSPPK